MTQPPPPPATPPVARKVPPRDVNHDEPRQDEYARLMGKGSKKSDGFPTLGQLGETALTQLRDPLYDRQKTEKDLEDDEMIRGYEFDKDKYVPVTDEELERLAPESSRDIDLRRFVDLQSIPPLYFDRSYFLVPSEGSEKAYKLLSATMEKEALAGIATRPSSRGGGVC